MPTRAEIAQLIAGGWAVVPLVAGRKNPDDSDWLKKVYTPEDFPEGANVGVKNGEPSDWKVDVDLDAPEAVQIGQTLLYETGCIHGRASKASSHWWYHAPKLTSSSYKDLDGEMLVELRSTGGQTVVPNSTHPSGEAILWVRQGKPTTIAAEELVRSVQAVALAALFARHWPASGSRHQGAQHLSGFLLRLGFDGPWVIRIVRAAAVAAGDDEPDDRAQVARDTAKKHANGGKTTGAPKLAEVFGRGDELASRVYGWMGREGDDQLDQLNARHFVAGLGSDTVIGTELTGEPTRFQDFEQFRRRYYSAKVGKQKLGEWWLSHPQQRRFRRVVFAPPPQASHPEDYNTWQGFTVEPDANPNPGERCRRYLEHLCKVICDDQQDHFAFLLDVLALTVQRPGSPTGVAVVMRGDPGAGKGTFVENFGRLFGAHYIQVDKQTHVTGRFNQHLSGRIVLFADEAVWAGSKQDIGALRRLVTERTLTIERKYLDADNEPNCIHLFMATNEEWVWPASLRERRGFILDVQKHAFQDQAYFDALYQEWEQEGGAAAFLAFCQQRQVRGQRLGPLPVTLGLQEQQKLSLDPVHQWWMDKLLQGDFGDGQGWPAFASGHALYTDYLYVTDQIGARLRRMTESQLLDRLKGLLPVSATKKMQVCAVNVARGGPPNMVTMNKIGWMLPSLTDCRTHFDALTGGKNEWPTGVAQQIALEIGAGDDVAL